MRIGLYVVAIALLGACAPKVGVLRGDAVIAGRTYVDEPIPFGPLKARLQLQGEVENTEQVTMTLGLLGAGQDKSIVVTGELTYGDGTPAELTGRFRVAGTAAGCAPDRGAALGTEYLFNAEIRRDNWTCVALVFRTPGRQPADAMQLTLNPINVAGHLVRMFPIGFTWRVPEPCWETGGKCTGPLIFSK